MMDLDITFEQGYEELEALCLNGKISGARLLTLMEDLPEEEAEDMLRYAEEQDWELDISDVPAPFVSGELARRLQLEKKLAVARDMTASLEEGDPLRLYLEELAGMPAAGDPARLALELLEGKPVQEHLMHLLLSQVVESAKGHTGRGVLLMDLIQEGSLGLWQGILCYTGGDIESDCHRWICRYMAKAVLLQARAAGLGQKLRQGLADYVDVDQKLLAELGRNPTEQEIAEQMHITVAEVATYEAMLQSVKSRSRVDAQREPAQESPEEEQAVEDTAYFQTRQAVAELMERLSPQEAQLIGLRYGLEGGQPLNPAQVGSRLGLTAEEVVAQEAAALKKLRNEGNA